MELYESILEILPKLPSIRAWAGAQTILDRMASLKPPDWELPILACRAVGGKSEQALPAAAAIACLQISIIMIDDRWKNYSSLQIFSHLPSSQNPQISLNSHPCLFPEA